ncbi:MAG TPA: WG repeat-containing protein [Saprospiraceae bacterium]|nr:WG repeat-containing protein [Saprospiraceae bacterium]HMQ82910.1 WG repeat-containing protein [Saprospiraceae bacterium]
MKEYFPHQRQLILPTYLIAVCLLLAIDLGAQSNALYPIKVDQKWGYMNAKGRTVIEPRYDIISDKNIAWHTLDDRDSVNTPYRLVELDKKLGLINDQKQEVLSTRYQRIYPLSHEFFAVVLDSRVTVVNQKEEIIFKQRYKDIRIADTSAILGQHLFLVREEKWWGLMDEKEQLILPMQYKNISPIHKNTPLLKVQHPKSGERWGLINREEKVILPFKFQAIRGIHPNYIAAQKADSLFAIYDSTGALQYPAIYHRAFPLNAHFGALISKLHGAQLLRYATGDTISLNNRYNDFKALDQYFVICIMGNRQGLLDSLAREVLVPTYYSIKPYQQNLYAVSNFSGLIGLYRPGAGEILPSFYSYIGSFYQGYAQINMGQRIGLMDTSFQVVIPPNYNSIYRDGRHIKALKEDKVTLFKTDETGKIIGVEDYSNVSTLRIRKEDTGPVFDAQAIKRAPAVQNEAFYFTNYPSPATIRDAKWFWKRDKFTKQWGLYLTQDSSILIAPKFRLVRHIREPLLGMVYQYEKPIKTGLSVFLRTHYSGLCRAALFSFRKGDFITAFQFIGLRRHDFERGLPYAAAVDTLGRFCLVDPSGNLLKDENGQTQYYSYIGEFVDGVARVSVGGKFEEAEDPAQNKFTLEPLSLFARKFWFTAIDASRDYKKRMLLAADEAGNLPKWGLIDSTGRVLVAPQYGFIKDNDEGQCVAMKDNNWGVINLKNEVIVPFEYAYVSNYYGQWRILERAKGPIYFNARSWQILERGVKEKGLFREGLCRVKKDSLWGYINELGEEITPAIYIYANDFSEGRATVFDGQWKIIDPSGDIVTDINAISVDSLGTFHENRCMFVQNGRYGYIDTLGHIAIEPKYDRAFEFQNGIARVVINRKTGLIDQSGQFLLEPNQFDLIFPFNEWGLAMAKYNINHNRLCVINTQGEIVVPPKYVVIDPFKEGFAQVSDGKTYGFINRHGEEIIPLLYEAAQDFSEGLAAVKKPWTQSWFFIDTTGARAIPQEYDKAASFQYQFARVQHNEHDPNTKALIDHRGKSIKLDADRFQFFSEGIFGMFSAQPGKHGANFYYANQKDENLFDTYFEEIKPFFGDLAIVRINGRKGVINQRGLVVVRPKYFYLELLPDNTIMAGPPSFGIADRSGKIIVQAEYDYVEMMSGNLYRLEKGGKIGYVKVENGDWVWPLQQ